PNVLGYPCKLYRNKGGFDFEDVTAKVGLDKLAGGAPWFYTHGVAVCDYDRDGWPDLLVAGWGRVVLFLNEPDGKGGLRFVDVTKKAGLYKGLTWPTSAPGVARDGDGPPNLSPCQYADCSWARPPRCTHDPNPAPKARKAAVCPPAEFSGLT